MTGAEKEKESGTDMVKRWWAMTTSQRRPAPDPARMVTVNELPMYAEDSQVQYSFIPDGPVPLQGVVAKFRRTIVSQYDAFAQRFQTVDRAVKSTSRAACGLSERLREEWSLLPKAAAITIGGMAGFVVGLKKPGIRRVLYPTAGLLTMAAFCYPHETVYIIRTGIAHTKMTWHRFSESPEPPQPKHDFSPPK